MKAIVKTLVLLAALFLCGSPQANATLAGGYRTCPGVGNITGATRLPEYIPFMSDYGTYWGQDNYDTDVDFYVGTAGTINSSSCWQSWTGAAAQCYMPATQTAASSNTSYDIYVPGFGYVSSSETSSDYYYVEVAPLYPATVWVYGVAYF